MLILVFAEEAGLARDGDYHEQQVARVRLSRSPLVLQVGHEQPVGPVRGGDMSGRSLSSKAADIARLDGREVCAGRQHGGDVIGARPLAVIAVVAPPKRRVCQRHRGRSCSGDGSARN